MQGSAVVLWVEVLKPLCSWLRLFLILVSCLSALTCIVIGSP